MSQVEGAVEAFLRSLSRSEKEQRPVCPHVVEVRLGACPGAQGRGDFCSPSFTMEEYSGHRACTA